MEQPPALGKHAQRWAIAVPTRGTRPDLVQAFWGLNPGLARPARASQAKQWGGARSREEVELFDPRVTSATRDENHQPSQHRVTQSPDALSKPASKRRRAVGSTNPILVVGWTQSITSRAAVRQLHDRRGALGGESCEVSVNFSLAVPES